MNTNEIIAFAQKQLDDTKRFMESMAPHGYGVCGYSKEDDFWNSIIKELSATIPRETAKCEWCDGNNLEVEHTHTTKIGLNTFGEAHTLVTECNPCPPYADCCMRGIPARSVFIINFCPNCGRKLSAAPEVTV